MPSTPYVVGQWVRGERFYGRAALIDEVLHGPRDAIWLLGTRRIGKTSLLKQIELLTADSARSGYFPIFWDFQGAQDAEELHRGFNDALLDAEERLDAQGLDPGEFEGGNVFDVVGRLRRRLRAKSLRLLLLCDEVEELINLHRKDPVLLNRLRRALQTPEDVRAVLASTIRLWALAEQRVDTSPFLHGFTPPLYIHSLLDDEAADLIRQTQLPVGSRPPIEDRVMEEIRRRCDSHPYLVQLVCKRHHDLKDLEEAIEQVGADQMVSYFFSVDFEMLSREERDVIRIIADRSSANSDSILDGIALEPGALSGILLRLEHLGYIRRDAERRFELRNSFFRRWFMERPHSRVPPSSAAPVKGTDQPSSEATTRKGSGAEIDLFDGRYRLMEKLGHGGTGVVHKARDEILRETIAIKILKSQYSANPDLLERFRREILLSRDLGHPNILTVYHLGDCGGQRYLAMRYIDGPTLARVIRKEGPIGVGRIIEVGRKLASALEAAHARKVIHRDIKPQNVLMDARGEPYLADFGLARLLTGPGITRSGVFLGTPDYASPEQAGGQETDERSDLYGLGVLLFEMATGKRPFVSDSSREVLKMHRSAPPPDPRSLRPGIPGGLSRLILRCLEKDPARRYQSARTLRLALEDLRVG